MGVINSYNVPRSRDEFRLILLALIRDHLSGFCEALDSEEAIEIQFREDVCNLSDAAILIVDPLEALGDEEEEEDDGKVINFEPSPN